MADKIFLDVNILVDLIDSSRAEHKAAKELFDLIESRKIQAFFSESVINTSVYLVRKVMPISVLNRLIIRLLELIKILSCTNEIVEYACQMAVNDLEDAVLYQIALTNKLNYFITNDKKDFKRIAHPSLKIVSAKDLMSLL